MSMTYKKHSIYIDIASVEKSLEEKKTVDPSDATINISITSPAKTLKGSIEIIPTFSFTLLKSEEEQEVVSFVMPGNYLSKFFEAETLTTGSSLLFPVRAWISDEYENKEDPSTVWGLSGEKNNNEFIGSYANLALIQDFIEPYFDNDIDFFNFLNSETVHAQTYTGVIRDKVIMNTAYLILDETVDEFKERLVNGLVKAMSNANTNIINVNFTKVAEGPEKDQNSVIYKTIKEKIAEAHAKNEVIEEITEEQNEDREVIERERVEEESAE